MAKLSSETRAIVKERAKGYCEYCRCHVSYSVAPFSIEHIQPVSRGGGDELENLAFSCLGCNGFKYNRLDCIDPVTLDRVRLYNPRTDKWKQHFTWSADYSTLIGLTSKGRATVSCLKLNRPALLNIRSVLAVFGEHPPME